MAIRYHYDLYPRTDPRDGARITRFTKLQRATYRDVIGVGSGAGVIRSTDPEADDLDPRGEQFVRVVRENTADASETTVGGFWINNYKHDTAVSRQTKRLTFAGAGTMAYLARARMAPHTYISPIFTGQDPFDGRWNLWAQSTFYANGNYLGAMLWRVIYEAQHFVPGTHRHKDGINVSDTHADDRTESAIPDLVMGFDQFEDSDGNPWTAKSGEFTAQIGENVLSVTKRLMEAGLYVEMDPVTFELRAWEDDEHRRDRTGGAWGASVVRFQAPTDGTVATGNMLSDSERELNSHLKRTAVWAGSGDTYALATGSSDIPWEGFESADLAETDALEQLAATQIQAREEAADAGSVRMKLGATPLSGRYRPWEEVRLDDLVTLDTGSGVWDYTEDTYPVAGLRIELQKSGAWWAWAELGASQPAIADRRFQVAPVGPHSHPPNPELCRVGFEAAFEALESLGAVCTLDPVNYSTLGGLSSDVERVQLTLDRNVAVGQSIVVITSHRGSSASEYALVDSDGNTYTEAAYHSGDVELRIWYANPANALSAGDILTYEVGGAGTGSLERGGKCITAYLFGGTISTPAESGTGSGFGGSPAVTVGAANLQVAAISWKGGASGFPDTFTPDADWDPFEEAATNASAADAVQIEGGFRLLDASSEAYNGTIDQSRDWVTVGATFATSSGSFTGDGPLEIVGTSIRASRCDHNHYHGDLLELDEQDHPASAITITDSGAYYTGTDVEAALQEIGAAGGGVSELDDIPDVDAPSPADGDVLTFASGSGDWINAAPTGGSAVWGTPSRTHVYRATDQNVAGSGTVTDISFSNEVVDDDGVWAIGTPTDLVIPAALNGRSVVVYGQIAWSSSTSGTYRDLRIVYIPNGGAAVTVSRVQVPTAGTVNAASLLGHTKPITVATGDVFQLSMRIDATGIGALGGEHSTYFGLYTVEAGGGTDYLVRRLAGEIINSNVVLNVNSTSYIQTGNTDFYHDFDQFMPTHFMITCFGGANAAATITMQLAAISAPGTPYSAGGNDLAVTNSITNYSSGWIAMSASPSGIVYVGVVMKGSTATVDFTGRWIEIAFKK
jgi:hypothetical protein